MRILDDRPELWPFVLASLALHILLFLLIPKAATLPSFEEKPIEVFAVQELPPPPGEQSPARIADIAKPAVEQRPASAKFLGLYDSSVSEEKVGFGKTPGEAGQGGKKFRTKIGGPEAKRRSAPSRPAAGERIFAFNRDLFEEKRSEVEEAAGFEAPGAPGALDDFYPDFKRGVHTYLNVLRYPGVEYFVRLKRAFKIAFSPEAALSEQFSQNLVSRGSIDVVLGVSVGRGGELRELFVFRSSGFASYDEEALRTVRVSSPFSSPPEKFVADDGLLRMTWTFSVYL